MKSALKGIVLVVPSLLVGEQSATINWFRQKGSFLGTTLIDNFVLFFDNKDGLLLTAPFIDWEGPGKTAAHIRLQGGLSWILSTSHIEIKVEKGCNQAKYGDTYPAGSMPIYCT